MTGKKLGHNVSSGIALIPCLEPLAEAVRRTSDKSFQEKVFILMPGVVALMVEE